MNPETDAALGEGLIALGLFGACFEAMVLAFRSKMQEWLVGHEPERLSKFRASCKTADNTFQFCGPRLVALGVITQSDYNALRALRQKRNHLTHDAYDHVASLRLAELAGDLDPIDLTTKRVANWRVPDGPQTAHREAVVGESIAFTVSPTIVTHLFRQLAEDLVERRLRQSAVVEPAADGAV